MCHWIAPASKDALLNMHYYIIIIIELFSNLSFDKVKGYRKRFPKLVKMSALLIKINLSKRYI